MRPTESRSVHYNGRQYPLICLYFQDTRTWTAILRRPEGDYLKQFVDQSSPRVAALTAYEWLEHND